MPSSAIVPGLVVFAERDESRHARVIDAVARADVPTDVVAVTTARAVRRYLDGEHEHEHEHERDVACVVVGEAIEFASASEDVTGGESERTNGLDDGGESEFERETGTVDPFLSSLAADYPDVPLVRFAGEAPAGGDSNRDRDDHVVDRIDPAGELALDHLAARLEAICATRRAASLERTLDHVADAATDGVAHVDDDGRIVALTPAFAATFGRDPGELRGRSIASVYDGLDFDFGLESGSESTCESDPEVELESTSGSHSSPNPDSVVVEHTGLERDPDPEDAGTETESESESEFESETATSSASPTAVLAGDLDRWTGTLIGRTPDGDAIEREHDVKRTAPDRVSWLVHPVPGPSDREEVLESHWILESMLERLPISLYVKDEAVRHIRASRNQVEPPFEARDGTMLTDPDQLLGKTDRDIYVSSLSEESIADDRRVIDDGEPVVEKVERYDVEPGEERWTLTSKVPWTDGDDARRGLIGVTTNITAEIEHERESERQRKRLEEFASVVAHDLRNPLAVAKGYVELARQTDSTEPLEDVDRSLERMERIVEDVLLLAREGNAVLEETSVALGPVVEEAWKQLSTGDATLRVAGDVRFRADRGRLLRLVENLLHNSVEHGGDGVAITVEPLEEEEVGAHDAHDAHDARDATGSESDVRGLGFAIEDDGPGIDPDDRETILESGYTTSREGTGFGLAIVEQIVDAHGWSLAVAESDDGGARFEITGLEPGE